MPLGRKKLSAKGRKEHLFSLRPFALNFPVLGAAFAGADEAAAGRAFLRQRAAEDPFFFLEAVDGFLFGGGIEGGDRGRRQGRIHFPDRHRDHEDAERQQQWRGEAEAAQMPLAVGAEIAWPPPGARVEFVAAMGAEISLIEDMAHRVRAGGGKNIAHEGPIGELLD